MTHLLGILAEIAEATDVETARKVALRFGGRRIKLPARPRESTPLAKAVGLPAARAIVDALGHGEHLIPFGPYGGPSARRRQAATVIHKGGSVAEAAVSAGVHERTAWRVKARMKDTALPLFERVDGAGADGGG